MKKRKKKIISAYFCLSIILFLCVMTIYIAADYSIEFADYLNNGLCQSFRQTMSGIGEHFEFSLFELLVFSIPLIIFFVSYGAVSAFGKGRGLRFVINLVATVLLIYSGHIIALGIGYKTTDVGEKMNLTETDVTEEALSDVFVKLIDEINTLAPLVQRNDAGVFDPGYSYTEISEKICFSYDELAKTYGFADGYYSTAKGFSNGAIMSYLGIAGIYTYPTGEANVNTLYPAYVTIFTAAHEMCHQRGILRENEANFVAYLITSTSDDMALRYSGALNMYEYFASALYKTNKEVYYSLAENLSEPARTDIRAANEITLKYSDTIFDDISEWINNFYLKSNGTEGVVSYSRVVELVLAYLK